MKSLRQRAVQGVLWSTVENWGSSLISILVILILARLLDKEAFGLVAFAGLFTVFLSIFQRQGFGQAIIQRRELQPGHLDTAFWTSATAGLVLTGLLVAVAGWIAPWFDYSGLAPVLRWLSITLFIDALASTPMAILRRELAFRVLAVRSLAATGIGGIVGVWMALNGYGVWSLVGQRIASSAAGTIALWTVSAWRPGLKISADHFRDLFGFGVFAMGRDIVEFFNGQADELIVATFLGAEALGVYWVGRRLLQLMHRMFTNAVSSVALPTFSRLQHDHAQMRYSLLTATRMSSLLAFPAFAGVAILAPELVAGLFGDKWAESVPVMQLLSLVGIVQCVTFFNNPAIIACGKPGWTFAITLANAVLGVVFCWVAARWGIAAVAGAHLIRTYALAPLPVWLVRRLVGLDIREYLRQCAVPAAASLAMVVLVWAAKQGSADAIGLHVRLPACIIIGVLVYVLVILWRAPSLARELLELLRVALSLRARKEK